MLEDSVADVCRHALLDGRLWHGLFFLSGVKGSGMSYEERIGDRKEGSGVGAKGCATGCMRWWRMGGLEEEARFSRLPEKGVKG